MKSRITIEVDFNNHNKPIIQIVSRHSDDIRDNLIKAFYQSLQGSSWCRVRFEQHYDNPKAPEENFHRILITPIPFDNVKQEGEEMLEQIKQRTEAHQRGEGYAPPQ
jgi:hypothetical protein